ncbi:spore germination protein [Paenibacillus ferrarius]|uniref:spore germination protein n=1 Tax=Paenibacillus ferrarius TaxID=1469647 RepID=UPI003D2E42B4
MIAIHAFLQEQFSGNDDFFQLEEIVHGSSIWLFGLRSMIDVPQTVGNLAITVEHKNQPDQAIKQGENESDALVAGILAGRLVILDAHSGHFRIIEPVSKQLNRAVDAPSSESVIQGAMAAFIEDMYTNVGIVREQFKSGRLKVSISPVGTEKSTSLALLYLDTVANPKLVREIKNHLHAKNQIDIRSLQDVSRILGFGKWNLISKFKITELPEEVAAVLEQGRVVLFVDRMPFALILPNSLWDAFTLGSDRNFPRPIMLSIRAVRLIGAFTTIILPALYVALVAVNPEVLRLQLALSVAQSRDGVPYPAAVETIIMLLLLELVLESSVRLPRSVGPTLTMVGGIILGQAVVAAQLVSNLLIIVLAATTIANSTIVGIQNGYLLRSLKYITVVLAAIFGVLGIFVGVVIICGLLAGESSFGISYVRLPFAKDDAEYE